MQPKNLFSILCLVVSLSVLSACTRSETSSLPQPSVTAILPALAKGGDTIRIMGTSLMQGSSNTIISINEKPAQIILATNDSIKAIVPALAGTGTVSVHIGSNTITGPTLTYDYKATVTTIAGTGSIGSADGPGLQASFFHPWGIAADAEGNLFVADSYNRLIRKILVADNTVSTFHIPTLVNGKFFASPYNVAVDTFTQNLYVTDFNRNLMKMDPQGNMQVIYEDSLALSGVAVSPTGKQLFVANNISGTITSLNMDGSNPVRFAHLLTTPRNLIFDNKGTLYVAAYPFTIAAINPNTPPKGIATIDGFKGWEAVVDTAGNFYLADHFSNCIRIIEKSGKSRIIAGSGAAADIDGIGMQAAFDGPCGIAIDKKGQLFVTTFNFETKKGNRVRKIVLE